MGSGVRRKEGRRSRTQPDASPPPNAVAQWSPGAGFGAAQTRGGDSPLRRLAQASPEGLGTELAALLRERTDHLVTEAKATMRQAQLVHYEQDGLPVMRQRLTALLEVTLECLADGRADALVEHTTRVAEERFSAGYDLSEVQTSINIVEEVLWSRILASVAPEQLVHALGLVSGLLDLGKDALARVYVSLAGQGATKRTGETSGSD